MEEFNLSYEILCIYFIAIQFGYILQLGTAYLSWHNVSV